MKRASERDLFLFGDLDTIRERYTQRYLPGQQLYLERCNPQQRADILIDNRDPDDPKIAIRPA